MLSFFYCFATMIQCFNIEHVRKFTHNSCFCGVPRFSSSVGEMTPLRDNKSAAQVAIFWFENLKKCWYYASLQVRLRNKETKWRIVNEITIKNFLNVLQVKKIVIMANIKMQLSKKNRRLEVGGCAKKKKMHGNFQIFAGKFLEQYYF